MNRPRPSLVAEGNLEPDVDVEFEEGDKKGKFLARSLDWAEWAAQNAKLQAPRRNRGIYEVLTEDEDYFKLIAGARLKLENDAALAMPCIEKNDSRGEPQATATSVDASEEQSDSENTGAFWRVKRQHMHHIAGKGYVIVLSVNSRHNVHHNIASVH